MVNNLLIVQARSGSQRLKNKIFLKISSKLTAIDLLLSRLKKSKKHDLLYLAVPKKDKKIFQKKLRDKKINIYYGNEKNVLKRFYNLASKINPKNIIRVTSDCPLLDPKILDKIVNIHEEKKVDYTANNYPDGQDVEIFSFKSFKKLFTISKSSKSKEHVTQNYYVTKKFKTYFYNKYKKYSFVKMSLDTFEDYIYIKKLYSLTKKKSDFQLEELIKITKNKIL